MKNIVVIGAGNVGIYAAKALKDAPDMNLCAFIRRKISPVSGFENIPVYKDVDDMPCKPDGAVICLPSGIVPSVEARLLEAGIAAVDAFDLHGEIQNMRLQLDKSAKQGNTAAIIGAGWDPGLDSVIRTLMQAVLPKGTTYTNFGPGMSMGHSAALKQISGIEQAVSITLPLEKGEHQRKIYAVLKEKANEHEVLEVISKNRYFEHESFTVEFVKDITPYFNTNHAVKIECAKNSESINFEMKINNPKLTANALVAAMRAAFLQSSGAYFMNEIPPSNFCFGNTENLI